MMIPSVIRQEVKNAIMRVYGTEAGLDVHDANFWEKVDEFHQKNADKEDLKEPEICSHCGQEM